MKKEPGALELLDWRRRMQTLYAEVRAQCDTDAPAAHAHWRMERERLFAAHPQSPLSEERRGVFTGLPFYDYDPALSFQVVVDVSDDQERHELGTSGGTSMAFRRFGAVDLPVGRLDVFWLEGYAGGVFLPLRDGTSGDTTYGGGRYLLDTAKGADLGSRLDGELVVDFNFAYNPSCHYSPTWDCPLAPPGNRLETRIEAGELSFPG